MAEVSSPGAGAVQILPRLDGYCVEAIRRLCICDAMKAGYDQANPRLRFVFVPLLTGQAV